MTTNKQFDQFDREAEAEAKALKTLCIMRPKNIRKYYRPSKGLKSMISTEAFCTEIYKQKNYKKYQ